MKVNGASITSDGVANIPVAGPSFGVVRINKDYGINKQSTESDRGVLSLSKASDALIKSGENYYKAIVPNNQHTATFYGLAKAAGDTTQSQSSNAVGAYTDEAKSAIQSMLGVPSVADMSDKVDKTAIDNAGITSYTYNTKFGGEFSVTTATTSGWLNPYARASVTGRIDKTKLHHVTINGTEYILPTRLWYEYESVSNFKVYEYLGNLGLHIADTSGVPGGTDNVPFIIISDLNNGGSIDVLTSTAGSYTINVEEMTPIQTALPKSLIWDDSYVPIEKVNNDGTYNGFSMGVNELANSRGTVAFGYANKVSNDFGMAIGTKNVVSGNGGVAIGYNNTNSGSGVAIGAGSKTTSNGVALGDAISSGAAAVAIGLDVEANCNNMLAIGRYNVLAKTSFPNFSADTFYKAGDFVSGKWMAQMPNMVWLCYKDHTSLNGITLISQDIDPDTQQSYWKLAPSNGDTLLALGNGTMGNDRSNAMKVDWTGNAMFKGDVYVHANADSSGGTKLATVDDIPEVPVQDVQVNGTSVVSDGVANVPVASTSEPGVVKVSNTYGLDIGTSGQHVDFIRIVPAPTNRIKGGDGYYNPITTNIQHSATFYGLAKAAGDTTQSQSDNAVGTYTDSAKASIKSMLGIIDGSTGTVTVTGTTPTITAVENTRYVCGEVSTLSITPPASGICIVRFTSGTTAAVVTVPNTVKFPEWFDITALDANTIYEMCITDGIYGAVMSWAL